MDFIEQLFGISPDNGDGSTEVLWLVALAIVLSAIVFWRRQGFPVAWPNKPSLVRRLNLRTGHSEQAQFASTARTRVGELEAVLVVSPIRIDDVVGLVGATVRIDGRPCVVHEVAAPEGKPIGKGEILMMKVRELP